MVVQVGAGGAYGAGGGMGDDDGGTGGSQHILQGGGRGVGQIQQQSHAVHFQHQFLREGGEYWLMEAEGRVMRG